MTVVPGIEARDFAEPFHAYDPYGIADRGGVLSHTAAELQYVDYVVKRSEWERFVLNTHVTAVPIVLPEVGALSLSLGSYLTAGPAIDDPTQHSQGFILNTIQFEYAARASVQCGRFRCLFGYGRVSQHRLRGGFLNTGVDILSAGVGVPIKALWTFTEGHEIVSRGFLIARNRELYDVWESPLPDPRSRWGLELRTLWGMSLSERVVGPGLRPSEICSEGACYGIFADLSGELLLLRDGGSDLEWTARVGVRRFVGNTLSSLFLYGTQTGDTRIKQGETNPALLLGLGGRVLVGSGMW